MALIEPQNSNLVGENYNLALNQSIQSLLSSLNKPTTDFSFFSSTFLDLIHARANPPLQTLWFHQASSFRANDSPKNDPFDKFNRIKDLFHSITAFSVSSSYPNSVVLIAPVIYELYGIIVDLKANGLSSKKDTKVWKEIKSLVDVILGYLNLCCVGFDNDGDCIRAFGDLVRVWIGGEGSLRLFFPLLGDEIIDLVSDEECDVREIAGAVIAEAFLLKLCLGFREGVSRRELENEFRTWAVCSITGFGNSHFFGIIVKMLLGTTLPVTSLLNSEDEIFLRKVLYDAVILVDYSFLNPERMAHLHAKHINSLAMARLMVTHEAIELFRKNGDQTKAISYTNAFSCSDLPSQLTKLVTSEFGTEAKASALKGSSPKAFLKWFLNLEDQGIRLFGDDVSKYRARLGLTDLKVGEELGYKLDGKKSDTDLFYIDSKGSEEEDDEKANESMGAAFVAAAHTMTSTENGGGKKRKEGRADGKNKKLKFLKYDLSGSSGEKSTFSGKDDSSSGSEVEDS